MRMPEDDLLRIGRWCQERFPDKRDRVRALCEIADRHVTIFESCPDFDPLEPWTQLPVARLRFTTKTGLWTLYWCDRNLRFHEYRRVPPTDDVQALLDHIADHGIPIFWVGSA